MTQINYYDTIYLYVKMIPQDDNVEPLIACIIYHEKQYQIYEMGGFIPIYCCSDLKEIITPFINYISTWNGFKNLSMSYYKQDKIKIPDKYEYIIKKYYDCNRNVIKSIPINDVKTRLQELLIGLRVLNSIIYDNNK
jgi:hypothetical protein